MAQKLVKLSLETHTKLKEMADKKGMPMNSYIAHLLELEDIRAYVDFRLSNIKAPQEKYTKKKNTPEDYLLLLEEKYYDIDEQFILSYDSDMSRRDRDYLVNCGEDGTAILIEVFPNMTNALNHEQSIEIVKKSDQYKRWKKTI